MEKYKWEVGATYTTTEMMERLGVGESTWSHNKNELLDNFKLYYEYEVIYEGRSTFYHILKKLGDYEPLPRKNAKQKHEMIYEDEIIEVVKTDKMQTAKNVARIIQDDELIKQFGYKWGTHYEYTRLGLRRLFGTEKNQNGKIGGILNKEWCGLDHDTNAYFKIPDIQYEEFMKMIRKEQQDTIEAEAEFYSNYQSGLISYTELNKYVGELSFGAFLSAQMEFKDVYGYRPIKVPVYGFYGTDILLFDDVAQDTKIQDGGITKMIIQKQQDYMKMPEYYPTMYLDGFTPEEILMAKRYQMLKEQRETAMPTDIHITSEVKIK